jgi:hypothetical protein
MPRQETLTIKNGDETVEVLKSYHETFAREAIRNMDDEALAHLAAGKTEELFVSGDWPTAEAYVRLMGLAESATSQSPA